MRSAFLYLLFILSTPFILQGNSGQLTQKLESLLKKANDAFDAGLYSTAEGYYESLHQFIQENDAHRNAVIQLSTHPAHSYSL